MGLDHGLIGDVDALDVLGEDVRHGCALVVDEDVLGEYCSLGDFSHLHVHGALDVPHEVEVGVDEVPHAPYDVPHDDWVVVDVNSRHDPHDDSLNVPYGVPYHDQHVDCDDVVVDEVHRVVSLTVRKNRNHSPA